jgi:hypothetical protein
VAAVLGKKGISCFFDESERVRLWGEDLTEKFDTVFRKECRFCVAFISKAWAERPWPAHERRSALARAVQEPGYFLPVRFDDVEVPGRSSSVAYLDGADLIPDELADLLVEKIRGPSPTSFLPKNPNRIFAALELDFDDEDGQVRADSLAHSFLGVLQEARSDERQLLVAVLRFGCPCYLPAQVHVLVDRLERVIDWDKDRIAEAAGGLSKLSGVTCGLVKEDPGLTVNLEWESMEVGSPQGPGTGVAVAMIREAGYGACDGCYEAALKRLDFSLASTVNDRSDEPCVTYGVKECPAALRDDVAAVLAHGMRLEVVCD